MTVGYTSCMGTKTIGEILRSEREFHRLSLDQLAKETRIRVEYLRALEQNKFDQLPAAAFVRGYIKTYGLIFGFDYRPLFALLRRDYKESAKGTLVPREFIKPVLKQRQIWRPVNTLILVLISVFVTILLYVVFQWYQLQRPPVLVIEQPVNDALVSSQVVVAGFSEPDAVVTVNDQAVMVDAAGKFATQITIPREGLVTITVKATDRQGKQSLKQQTVTVSF